MPGFYTYEYDDGRKVSGLSMDEAQSLKDDEEKSKVKQSIVSETGSNIPQTVDEMKKYLDLKRGKDAQTAMDTTSSDIGMKRTVQQSNKLGQTLPLLPEYNQQAQALSKMSTGDIASKNGLNKYTDQPEVANFMKSEAGNEDLQKSQEAIPKYQTGDPGIDGAIKTLMDSGREDLAQALIAKDAESKSTQNFKSDESALDRQLKQAQIDNVKTQKNITLGEKDSQYLDKRFNLLSDALDPSKTARGPMGVSKQVFDRAERLESLAGAFSDGNLDSRQVEELAIGLNAMLSGSNTGAQRQVEALVPKSVVGNAMKLKEFLTNKPQGVQQQEFVKRMLGSISREKQTASDQLKRTQFSRISAYSGLAKSDPARFDDILLGWGIDPQEYGSWKAGGHKQTSAVQKPEINGTDPNSKKSNNDPLGIR